MVCRFDDAGLQWPCELPDCELEGILYAPAPKMQDEILSLVEPDWNHIHHELRRRDYHVTRKLLWKEYKAANPDAFYRYSWFCKALADWGKALEPVMRQVHRYGDKCFVDFAGDKLPVFDPQTGEIRMAEVFVGTLGGSNLIYCDACWSQDLPTWLRLHLDMFKFFGGCPAALVPDNLKSGVTSPCYYEPSVNISYEEMAKYHGVAVIPARVRKPKDKAKAESSVLIAEREILAPLRHRTLIGLSGAKEAIWEKLDEVNSRPFQKLMGTRQEVFEEHEKSKLKPLPTRSYDEGIWSQAKVHIDYHIEVSKHYYSVPFQHIGRKLDVRLTANTLEAFWEGHRVASHRRGWTKGGCTTLLAHMPEKHQRLTDWTPSRLISWAETTGPYTGQLVVGIMERRMHPEQGVRASLGVLGLKKKYGRERLEAACERAVYFGAFARKSVISILERNLDEQALGNEEPKKTIGDHENIRGPKYYEEKLGDSHHVVPANH
jgi:transposase